MALRRLVRLRALAARTDATVLNDDIGHDGLSCGLGRSRDYRMAKPAHASAPLRMRSRDGGLPRRLTRDA